MKACKVMSELDTLQCILFNYPIPDERIAALLEYHGRIGDRVPKRERFRNCRKKADRVADSLLTSLSADLHGEVTLLFSSGYDSRCLFAALRYLGYEFETVVWSTPNPLDERSAVARICGKYDVPLHMVPKEIPSIPDMEASVTLFAERTSGRLSASRSFLIPLLSGIVRGRRTLIWGEGELLRPPVLPSEYANRNVLHLLSYDPSYDRISVPGVFTENLAWEDAFYATRDSIKEILNIPRSTRLALWMAFVSYPAIYGTYTRAVSCPADSMLPFQAEDVVNAMLSPPLSLYAEGSWRRTLPGLTRLRKLYARVLYRLDPVMLRYRTDRGYAPILDIAGLGGVATVIGRLAQGKKSRSRDQIRCNHDAALVGLVGKTDLHGLADGKEKILQSLILESLSGTDRYEIAKLLSIAIAWSQDTTS